jgi:hypothetical protein
MRNALGELEVSIAKNELVNYIFGSTNYEFTNPLLETPTHLDTISAHVGVLHQRA